jgi:aryl-alcohol dehydrogenase-like predicted oxidoreductase
MKYSPLGDTGIEVSRVALGAVKMGRNEGVKFPEPFELPSDKELLAFLKRAQELGVNTICMSRGAYGKSTERLAKLLPLVGGRDAWVLVENVGETFESGQSSHDFSPEAIKESIYRTLGILDTNHLDLVLLHSNGDEEFETTAHLAAFPALKKLKDEGLIRAFGMSTKTLAGGRLTLQHADVVMLTYHEGYEDEHPLILEAAQQNKGVLVKKSLGSGHLPNPTDALAFVLKEEGVSSVVMGTVNIAHLEANCSVASRDRKVEILKK